MYFLSEKVGGVKEKILAAYNSSIKTVIIPDHNMNNLKTIPNNIKVSIFKIKKKCVVCVFKNNQNKDLFLISNLLLQHTDFCTG